MSSSDSEEVENHGNLFDDPEGYYPPTPPPTVQTYTTRTGETIQLHLVGYSPTEAHHLWNGSRVISDYFQDHPDEVRGRSVLELGAGAGLPSLMAAVLGASRVVMTDYPDVEIVQTMWKNIDECGLIPRSAPAVIGTGGEGEDKESLKDDKKKMKEREEGYPEDQDVIVAKGFVWGANPSPLLAELPNQQSSSSPTTTTTTTSPKFDVLILADLLFRHSEHGHLLDTIRDTLAPTAGSKAFVFFTSYRPWLQHKDLAFFDLARARGFVVDKLLERKMDQPMFVNDPGDEEVRKTCTGWVVRWPQEGEGEE